jgi:UDP-N-acetylmuramyl tripeptide synthase
MSKVSATSADGGPAQRSLPTMLAGFDVPAPEVEVSGVETDSRRIAPGDRFLACSGRGTHGLAHLEQALERGAAAVAWEPAPGWAQPQIEVPEIAVPQLSRRAGEIAARFFGRPSERMFCAGVTGTRPAAVALCLHRHDRQRPHRSFAGRDAYDAGRSQPAEAAGSAAWRGRSGPRDGSLVACA